jgi:hypothetical protein
MRARHRAVLSWAVLLFSLFLNLISAAHRTRAITTVVVQMGDANNIIQKILVLGALALTFAAT